MALDAAQKKTILDTYGVHEGDTGSPEAQVALLTKRIATSPSTSSSTSTTTTPAAACCCWWAVAAGC